MPNINDRVTTEMVREDFGDLSSRVWIVVKVDGEEVFRNVFLSHSTRKVDEFYEGTPLSKL